MLARIHIPKILFSLLSKLRLCSISEHKHRVKRSNNIYIHFAIFGHDNVRIFSRILRLKFCNAIFIKRKCVAQLNNKHERKTKKWKQLLDFLAFICQLRYHKINYYVIFYGYCYFTGRLSNEHFKIITGFEFFIFK